MSTTAIFLPMLVLMFWTFLILVQVPIRRFLAVFAGRVQVADFRHGESARVPADVTLPNRIFMNLVEVPPLFYVLCLLYYFSGQVTPLVLTLAWVYVGLRLAHSLIYLTYNHVIHRFAVFATSNVLLVGMIGWLISRLV